MSNTNLSPPKGTRDISGEAARKFQKIIDVCKKIFESYGFEPLFTPAFENFEILAAKGGLGEAVKEEIYCFKDKGGRELGLRFDLTVPLARFVALHKEITKPYKRYAIAPVWRYDNPQRLRYREFWQADADIIGSSSTLADAECLAMACEVMEKLGFEKFSIRISDREFLEKLFKEFSEEKRTKIFRCIDKMDKIGEEGVISEIDSLGVNGREVIEKLKKAKEKKALTKRLEELFSCARALGIEEYITFDPFIVRGLDYYTSLVFEIDTGVGVSCGGGGRYDNLIGIFSKVPTPATGISLGISRLVEIMKNPEEGRIRVFIPLLEKSLLQEYYALARFLRKRGVLCEIYCDEKPLRKQLDYANSKKFDFSIFLGRGEKEKNVIKIRNMRTGEETLASAPEEVMECLKGTEK